MELSYESPYVRLYQGDSRHLPLEDGTVSCVVTSPAYLGLRKYAGEQELIWDEPTEGCEHVWGESLVIQGHHASETNPGKERYTKDALQWSQDRGQFCQRCGAWRGAFGLEPTPELYIRHLMTFMDELWRVLRADGVCFINLGDSMAGSNNGSNDYREQGASLSASTEKYRGQKPGRVQGIRPKSLMLIPERFALACQERGWIVRSRIVWAKPNPMPESVSDRPTDAWEHIWMLVKQERYWFDGFAVAEPSQVTATVVEYKHGQENMQDMFAGTPPNRVLPSEESSFAQFHMQGLRQETSDELEKDRNGKDKIQGILRAVETQPQREGDNRQTRTLGEAQAATESILPEPSWEECPTQSQYFGEGACEDAEVLPFVPGADSVGSEDSASEDEPQYPNDLDGQGMGGHQEALQDGVCLLRTETRSLNQRSYNPSDKGGAARQGEHPPRVPKLQYSEKQPYSPQQPTRNLRNFWVIPTEPFPDAHFAVFPTAIPERCILAACPPAICAKCGKPRERIVERQAGFSRDGPKTVASHVARGGTGHPTGTVGQSGSGRTDGTSTTLGWTDCGCGAEWIPGLVLDPFSGAGTTAMVAQQLGRRAIGVDLSAAYTAMAIKRLESVPLPMVLL